MGWDTTNKKTLSGKITLDILHAKRRTQCDDVGMHALTLFSCTDFVPIHLQPPSRFASAFHSQLTCWHWETVSWWLHAFACKGPQSTAKTSSQMSQFFQDFQVTGKLRGETQRSQGVAPSVSRPLEWIYKHSSNARHVISMWSPTNSRENKTCPAKHFKVDKGGKEEGWSNQRTGVTPSSFTDVYSIYLLYWFWPWGWQMSVGMMTWFQDVVLRSLVSKEVCWLCFQEQQTRPQHTKSGSATQAAILFRDCVHVAYGSASRVSPWFP